MKVLIKRCHNMQSAITNKVPVLNSGPAVSQEEVKRRSIGDNDRHYTFEDDLSSNYQEPLFHRYINEQ